MEKINNNQLSQLAKLRNENWTKEVYLDSETHTYKVRSKPHLRFKALPNAIRDCFHPNPPQYGQKQKSKQRRGGSGKENGNAIHKQLYHRSMCLAEIHDCKCQEIFGTRTLEMKEDSFVHEAVQQAEKFREDHCQIPLLAEIIVTHQNARVATRIDALDFINRISLVEEEVEKEEELVLVEWKTGYNSRSFKTSREFYKHPMNAIKCSEANVHQWQLFGQYMLLTRSHGITNIKKACVVYLKMANKPSYHVECAADWWWPLSEKKKDELWDHFQRRRTSFT